MHTQASLASLADKNFRDSYVDEHVRSFVAYQLRSIRKNRKLTQKQLANILSKPPSVVSRLENVQYGRLNVQTLLEIAHKLDVALVVKFSDFQEFLTAYTDISENRLAIPPYDESYLDGNSPAADTVQAEVIPTDVVAPSPSVVVLHGTSTYLPRGMMLLGDTVIMNGNMSTPISVIASVRDRSFSAAAV